MTNAHSWRKPFFTFWIAQAFSIFGSSLTQFALVWWLTERTGSATVLATAALVAMLPGIMLGPLAGVLVDRWNRRLVILGADLVSAGVAAGLALLFWLDAIELWHIYTALAVRALAGAFQFPAVQASTALMAPQEQLARVAGLNQLLQGVMQIVAPPLGALLLGLLPFPAMMGIDVVTALIAVGLVFTVKIPQPLRTVDEASAGRSSIGQEFRAGLRYIWQWPGLLWVLALSSVLNLLLTPAFSLLPILVTDHFGGGALELAWINTASGVGFVLGGLILSVWGGFRRRVLTSLLGLVGLGVGVLTIGLTPASGLLLALVGMAVVGMMGPITNGPFFAIIQSVVAPEMQGRVFTVLGSTSAGMAPIGLAIAGPLADWLGVRVWYGVGGVACLALSLIMACIPAIMRLEEGRTLITTSVMQTPVDEPAVHQPTGVREVER